LTRLTASFTLRPTNGSEAEANVKRLNNGRVLYGERY
jgi:hypothetical protein